MLTHCNRPKVSIKLLKISYVRIFLVSLLFVAVINPYSVFLNFQFLNILVNYTLTSNKPSHVFKGFPKSLYEIMAHEDNYFPMNVAVLYFSFTDFFYSNTYNNQLWVLIFSKSINFNLLNL